MKNIGAMTLTLPSETSILLERSFDAPRTLVWRAWTEPELVRRWYAPPDHEMTECAIDLRVGGRWRYAWRQPDGSTLGQSGTYQEIEPPARLVNTEGMDGYPGEVLVTYTFVEAGGSTTMRCLTECGDRAIRDLIANSGMETGAAAMYERLAALLPGLRQ